MIRLCAFADEADPRLSGQIRALRRGGIDLIELRGVDGKNVADLSDADAKRIKNELDACGIAVWSLGSPYGKVRLGEDFDREALFARLHRLCVLAGIFGTDKIRMFSFYCSDGRRGEVIDLLRESVNVAASYGVTLYHENEKDIYGDTVQRVLDLYEHVPGMRFVYDPANFIQCGVKAAESLPALAGLCGYYHIKDVIADTQQLIEANRQLIAMLDQEAVSRSKLVGLADEEAAAQQRYNSALAAQKDKTDANALKNAVGTAELKQLQTAYQQLTNAYRQYNLAVKSGNEAGKAYWSQSAQQLAVPQSSLRLAVFPDGTNKVDSGECFLRLPCRIE